MIEHCRSVCYFRMALAAKRQFSKTWPLVDYLSTSPEDLRKKSLLPDYDRPIKRHAIAVDSSLLRKVFLAADTQRLGRTLEIAPQAKWNRSRRDTD